MSNTVAFNQYNDFETTPGEFNHNNLCFHHVAIDGASRYLLGVNKAKLSPAVVKQLDAACLNLYTIMFQNYRERDLGEQLSGVNYGDLADKFIPTINGADPEGLFAPLEVVLVLLGWIKTRKCLHGVGMYWNWRQVATTLGFLAALATLSPEDPASVKRTPTLTLTEDVENWAEAARNGARPSATKIGTIGSVPGAIYILKKICPGLAGLIGTEYLVKGRIVRDDLGVQPNFLWAAILRRGHWTRNYFSFVPGDSHFFNDADISKGTAHYGPHSGRALSNAGRIERSGIVQFTENNTTRTTSITLHNDQFNLAAIAQNRGVATDSTSLEIYTISNITPVDDDTLPVMDPIHTQYVSYLEGMATSNPKYNTTHGGFPSTRAWRAEMAAAGIPGQPEAAQQLAVAPVSTASTGPPTAVVSGAAAVYPSSGAALALPSSGKAALTRSSSPAQPSPATRPAHQANTTTTITTRRMKNVSHAAVVSPPAPAAAPAVGAASAVGVAPPAATSTVITTRSIESGPTSKTPAVTAQRNGAAKRKSTGTHHNKRSSRDTTGSPGGENLVVLGALNNTAPPELRVSDGAMINVDPVALGIPIQHTGGVSCLCATVVEYSPSMNTITFKWARVSNRNKWNVDLTKFVDHVNGCGLNHGQVYYVHEWRLAPRIATITQNTSCMLCRLHFYTPRVIADFAHWCTHSITGQESTRQAQYGPKIKRTTPLILAHPCSPLTSHTKSPPNIWLNFHKSHIH